MKLNKKGYMLIEIILASAIAFGVGYFILQMIINLKNKNDDLLVETLTTTDQTIIINKLMQYAMEEDDQFTCKLTTDGKTLYYEDKDGNKNIIDIVNDYAVILADENGALNDCSVEDGMVYFSVPISVAQMPNENFDATLNYRYDNSSNSNDPDGDDGVCVVKYDCGESGYWNGAPGSDTFIIDKDTNFKLVNYGCVNTERGIYRKQSFWVNNNVIYYYGTEINCSNTNLVKDGNIVKFYAGWTQCPCNGTANTSCGDGSYNQYGIFCIGNKCCQ